VTKGMKYQVRVRISWYECRIVVLAKRMRKIIAAALEGVYS
jgi:hypothetical protein